jgi:hypothetical protein
MNKKNFDMMMNKFAKVYEKTLDQDDQVNYIIQDCFKKCHFFPRPADIFEHSDPYEKYYRKE